MWFLLTLVTANIYLRKGRISFTFGKKNALSDSSETTWWLSSWASYHFSSPFGYTPLIVSTKSTRETNAQTSITQCKCEWNRAWWVGFASSVFQPGLINSNKFREVMSDDAHQAGSYSPVVYYFTLPQAQSLTFTTLKGHEVKFCSQI